MQDAGCETPVAARNGADRRRSVARSWNSLSRGGSRGRGAIGEQRDTSSVREFVPDYQGRSTKWRMEMTPPPLIPIEPKSSQASSFLISPHISNRVMLHLAQYSATGRSSRLGGGPSLGS